jgi:hypothetical protein
METAASFAIYILGEVVVREPGHMPAWNFGHLRQPDVVARFIVSLVKKVKSQDYEK